MVSPLPPVLRQVSNVLETATEVSFDLVVRTPERVRPILTYGGGRLTINKPFTDVQMQAAINNAVRDIIRDGDNALPKDHPEGQILTSATPRLIGLHIGATNAADRRR